MQFDTFRLTRRRALILPAGLAGIALTGCSVSGGSKDAGKLIAWPAKDKWPDQFRQSDIEVQEAYRYNIANPETMKWFPCFCGCGAQGHRYNLDCYVREFRDNGSVELDPMSFG
jgi:hypothetical protein